MNTVRDEDLHWVENHLQCAVTIDPQRVARYDISMNSMLGRTALDAYEYDRRSERIMNVRLSESEMHWLIKTLKELEVHRELQRRYPGVAQAYADYDITARMASYYEDGNTH